MNKKSQRWTRDKGCGTRRNSREQRQMEEKMKARKYDEGWIEGENEGEERRKETGGRKEA